MRTLYSLIILLCLTTGAFPATLWVAQTANGNGSGTSYANRASVTTHNGWTNTTVNPGDQINFCGTITSRIDPNGSVDGTAGNLIVYDGNDCASEALGAAVISTDDGTGVRCMLFAGNDYIEIRDFVFSGARCLSNVFIDGSDFVKFHSNSVSNQIKDDGSDRLLMVHDPSTDIEIYNNEVDTSNNADPYMIISLNANNNSAINNVDIYRNYFHGTVEHDAIDARMTGSGGTISNVTVRENRIDLYAGSEGRGLNLVAPNVPGSSTINNIVAKHNYLTRTRAWSTFKGSNVYVFGNIFYDIRPCCYDVGIDELDNVDTDCTQGGPQDCKASSGCVGVDNPWGCCTGPGAGCPQNGQGGAVKFGALVVDGTTLTGDMVFANNTVYQVSEGSMIVYNESDDQSDLRLINNLLIYGSNDPGSGDNDRSLEVQAAAPTFGTWGIRTNNIWPPIGGDIAYVGGVYTNINELNAYAWASNNISEDPQLEDPSGGNFGLTENSGGSLTGEDTSGINEDLKWIICPGSPLPGLGVVVQLCDQDTYGYVMGAVAYDALPQQPTGEIDQVEGQTIALAAAPPQPPAQVTNPSPPDGAIDQAIDVDTSWDAAVGADSYDVYFGTIQGNPTFIGNQPGTTYDPGVLANLTQYFWRIDSVNTAGTTTGVEWDFTTVAAAPTWVQLVNGVDVETVTLADGTIMVKFLKKIDNTKNYKFGYSE